MKTKLPLLALLIASSLLASCASSPSANAGASASATKGSKAYPLKVCLVTDNDLDSMGDQQTHYYQGQQIKICCEACWDTFLKNPAKYLAKLPK